MLLPNIDKDKISDVMIKSKIRGVIRSTISRGDGNTYINVAKHQMSDD